MYLNPFILNILPYIFIHSRKVLIDNSSKIDTMPYICDFVYYSKCPYYNKYYVYYCRKRIDKSRLGSCT